MDRIDEIRITRVYNDNLRVAEMCARVNRNEGYQYVRIDAVANPDEDQPFFYVLASREPLDGFTLPGVAIDPRTSWAPPADWGIRIPS